MMMNIILAACFVPIWPVLYFLLRNQTKPKKNIILSVTLPQSAHGNPEVLAVCASFKKWLGITLLPLLPLLAPPFFMRGMGLPLTWFLTWLLFLIIIPFAVFAVHRGKLMALKRERGWRSETAGQALADVRAAVQPPKRVGAVWFLIPVLISFVPAGSALLNGGMWGMAATYLTFALMTLLFWVMYSMIFRLRAEIVNENLSLTMALTHARRYQWSKFWVAATWLTGLLNLTFWLFEENVTAVLTAVIIYTILLITVAMQTEFAARVAQQKLTAEGVGDSYLDEDEYWLLGLFYHNPNDHHFLVNDRIGMNMSVNLAKPAGKALMAISAVIIAAMPFIGLWIWTEEVTPVTLVMSGTELTVRHTRDVYTIPFESIDSLELIDELPFAHRTAGTAMDTLYKGRWSVRGYGDVRLCLNPQKPPFLVIETSGNTYILNDSFAETTDEVYHLLRFARR